MKFAGKIISGNITCDIKESYLVPKNLIPLGVGVSDNEQQKIIEQERYKKELERNYKD